MLSKKRKSVSEVLTKSETFATRAIPFFEQIEFPEVQKKDVASLTIEPGGANKTFTTTTTTSATEIATRSKTISTEKTKEKEEEGEEKPKSKKAKKVKSIVIDRSEEVTEVVDGFKVMNPYKNPITLQIFVRFMKKYFSDNNTRVMILGINPSRLGAGITGIPFTDPNNIKEKLGIDFPGLDTLFGKSRKEPSGEFIHDLITNLGGPAEFFSKFYITSASPLGFIKDGKNKNFYDDKKLREVSMPFIVSSISSQLKFGISRKAVVCLGTGELAKAVNEVNNEHKFFEKVLPVEHPRAIVQYKRKEMATYMEKYIKTLKYALELAGLGE